jgi:hypothetical protein
MLVIFIGCVSRSGALPVTFIVTVDPRSTLIQPNKPPFPYKSLVMYFLSVVLVLLSYSVSTFILRGAVDIQLTGSTVAVGVGCGVLVGATVSVGVGATVDVGVGLGVAFGVLVGATVSVGVGVGDVHEN